MSITSLLAGLLFPALSSVRENANRVLCGSNQRQLRSSHHYVWWITSISIAKCKRAIDEREPDPSLLAKLRNWSAANRSILMSCRGRPSTNSRTNTRSSLGWLRSPVPMALLWMHQKRFYCPSHKGEHTLEECSELWKAKRIDEDLFGNYHYVGSQRLAYWVDDTHSLKWRRN